MARKTDSNNPADWLWIAASDLEGIQSLANQLIGYEMCRSKLAEVLEKILKAELLRLGWFLEKTHDLERLLDLLVSRKSDLAEVAEPLCDALNQAYFTTRYPGFDFEDPDWPQLKTHTEQVASLLQTVRSRLP